MSIKLIAIGEVARKINVSIDTLRRWDKIGRFVATRKSGKRFYREDDVEDFIRKIDIATSDIYKIAQEWALSAKQTEPEEIFYCPNSLVFQSQVMKFEKKLAQVVGIENTFPLISAIVGEIGNNSFDHNLGSWVDIPGIFFGYDLEKREIVLADRGQGILKTLKRVRPKLDSDEEALRVAFSEIVSGRAPEARGNGLKFVKNVVVNNEIKLLFKTGSAKLNLKKGDRDLDIKKEKDHIQGCIILINF
jgi:DNA-binding transcriptional MerR regulator